MAMFTVNDLLLFSFRAERVFSLFLSDKTFYNFYTKGGRMMPVITKISVQQQNKERYNIYLDGQYAFSVDEEVLARYGLKKGKELNELDLTEIRYHDEIRKGVNAAVQFLAHRMRSEKEVMDHLKKKEWDDTIIQEVMHKLREYQYVNDEQFAQAFVQTQWNTTDKGTERIQRELREKGIAESIIKRTMTTIDSADEWERAMKLAEKWAQKHASLSELMIRRKVEEALLRKGYPSSIVLNVLSELVIEKSEEEEWEAVKKEGDKAHRRYSKYDGYVYEQKMKQALYRKGFSMEWIERYLSYRQEEE
jgi:regulatory protein